MKIIGLDFETANHNAGSICSAGVAVIQDGCLTDSREWLVRPHASLDWMLPEFSEIHGICYYDLRNAPDFFAVWPALKTFLTSGDCVAIHNAPFDLRHLEAVLDLYKLPSTAFDYVCTLAASRQIFPELPSHSLDAVAGYLGHVFHHHDALEDAVASATILAQIKNPESFQKRFEYQYRQA